jgi:hypothetical protein
MNRRAFMSLAGGSLASLRLFSPRILWAASGALLVDTAEKRFKYADEQLNRLCATGPAPAGSPAYEQRIRMILAEMRRSIPDAFLDEYRFEGWEVVKPAELTVGDARIETFCGNLSLGTPPEGVEGTLKKTGERVFSVVDAKGKQVATLHRSTPKARASGYQPREQPTFSFGNHDLPIMEAAAAAGTLVRASVQTRRTTTARDWNAVGTIPGKSQDEILVLAHADTVYNAPGANDNTATVVVMLMLAHAFSRDQPELTLTFVATGSEEHGGYLGAAHYAGVREQAGDLGHIKWILNMDSLTYGADFGVSSQYPEIRELFANVHKDLNIRNPYPGIRWRNNDVVPGIELIDGDGWVMDAGPFKPSGGKAAFVYAVGMSAITHAVQHTPQDIPATVPMNAVETTFLILQEAIQRFPMLSS